MQQERKKQLQSSNLGLYKHSIVIWLTQLGVSAKRSVHAEAEEACASHCIMWKASADLKILPLRHYFRTLRQAENLNKNRWEKDRSCVIYRIILITYSYISPKMHELMFYNSKGGTQSPSRLSPRKHFFFGEIEGTKYFRGDGIYFGNILWSGEPNISDILFGPAGPEV